MNGDLKPGLIASACLASVLLTYALSVNFPKASGGGFKGDEATYYVLAHSLADDFDFSSIIAISRACGRNFRPVRKEFS